MVSISYKGDIVNVINDLMGNKVETKVDLPMLKEMLEKNIDNPITKMIRLYHLSFDF